MASSANTKNGILTPKLPEHASIKIVGLGGVGAIIARYAALFLASEALNRDARLVLVDGDAYDPGNLARMLFKTCGNKATVLRNELLEYLADSRVTILAVESYLTSDNLRELIHDGDIVILAVDNHRTRKLVSDYVTAQTSNIRLISAGNDPVGEDGTGRVLRGTFGNCQIHVRRDGEDVTPSLTRWHPEIDNPADDLPTDASCVELASSAPQVLFTNLATASAALNAFYRLLCDGPEIAEVAFDIIDAVMRPVPLPTPQPQATS